MRKAEEEDCNGVEEEATDDDTENVTGDAAVDVPLEDDDDGAADDDNEDNDPWCKDEDAIDMFDNCFASSTIKDSTSHMSISTCSVIDVAVLLSGMDG